MQGSPSTAWTTTGGWNARSTGSSSPRPRIDLTHPDTVTAIKASGMALSDTMTISDLTSEDRSLTTTAVQWIRSQALDDGRNPAGIRYPSKSGVAEDDYCYAGCPEAYSPRISKRVNPRNVTVPKVIPKLPSKLTVTATTFGTLQNGPARPGHHGSRPYRSAGQGGRGFTGHVHLVVAWA